MCDGCLGRIVDGLIDGNLKYNEEKCFDVLAPPNQSADRLVINSEHAHWQYEQTYSRWWWDCQFLVSQRPFQRTWRSKRLHRLWVQDAFNKMLRWNIISTTFFPPTHHWPPSVVCILLQSVPGWAWKWPYQHWQQTRQVFQSLWQLHPLSSAPLLRWKLMEHVLSSLKSILRPKRKNTGGQPTMTHLLLGMPLPLCYASWPIQPPWQVRHRYWTNLYSLGFWDMNSFLGLKHHLTYCTTMLNLHLPLPWPLPLQIQFHQKHL